MKENMEKSITENEKFLSFIRINIAYKTGKSPPT
jgi:hypothetical protein